MIALQRALEGRAAGHASRHGAGATLSLLQRAHRRVAVVGVVVVKAVAILGGLLASVDAEGHEADDDQDDGTANTDDHANNDVARRR